MNYLGWLTRMCLVLTAVPGILASAEASSALFEFSPMMVAPGGALTVWGVRFDGTRTGVTIKLVTAEGRSTILGTAPLSSGAFRTTAAIPSSTSPGRYYINVADSPSRIALNLSGSPIVTPAATPWFQFSPDIVAPQRTIAFSGSGFNQASSAVGIAVLDKNEKATLLGYAALNAGSFSTKITLPASLTPNGVAVNPVTNKIYELNSLSDSVSVIQDQP